ncbi:RHS repeat domain-containing protein [Lysobacter antibioticus]|uniref:RHS repeat-associated core domain protein n=1 Tax=Lysobacter antibioticus TaxID=84531 RepID=A0A0S2F7R1_LYSAN|nr:RHS repeat-associated core domain-containing protein [Lysobacter antibioticus]ALN79568.1 RHS repeat-associated core domain protein [Lysobacter antibioticus]
MKRLSSLLFLLLCMLASAVSAQEHRVPSMTMYLAGVSGKSNLYSDPDLACRLVGDSLNATPYPYYSTTHTNARYGTHPDWGIGCYYDEIQRVSGAIIYNQFRQNYVVPKQVCPNGYNYLKGEFACVRYWSVIAPNKPGQQCDVGNPITCNNGAKSEAVQDDLTAQLSLTRTYYSAPVIPGAAFVFGKEWYSDLTRALIVSEERPPAMQAAFAIRENGKLLIFSKYADGEWRPEDDLREYRLKRLEVNGQVSWRLGKPDNSQEIYDSHGRIAQEMRDGRVYATYLRDESGRVKTVLDASGRSATLTYANTAGNLTRIDLPDGQSIVYAYDESGRLAKVTKSVGETDYSYTTILGSSYLTQIAHDGVPYAAFAYDDRGRAISTEHAGGVERYAVNYGADGSNVSVSTPEGGALQLQFRTQLGVNIPTQVQNNGADSQSFSSGFVYDTKSNVVTKRSGNLLTCNYYDANWLYVTASYQYPGSVASCPPSAAAAAATASLRGTATVWDEGLALPLERSIYSGGGSLLSKQAIAYNARGQVLSSTAIDPASPGSTRAATTKYCEQADIAAGSCPSLGLVTSVDGPRTDVADITQYSYYASDDPSCAAAPTTCPHRKGDLWKITNALGQVAEILRYDGAGRVLSSKDPNGVITDLEYHPRGWLAANKLRGPDDGTEADDAITRFEYKPSGLIGKVMQADGSYTQYDYDAAQRLIDVRDNAGNSVHYTLDPASNRIKEETKDSLGALKRTLSRVYNQLGQLKTAKDAYENATSYTYDAAGNADTVTDALGSVTDSDYDPLGRLVRTLQDMSGINAQILFQHDALNRITQVTDPKGLNTVYGYNGFGDIASISSQDTGGAVDTFDGAGNQKTRTDARGVQSTRSYDALNRVTGIGYPDSSLNIGYTYDVSQGVCAAGETFSQGRLTQVTAQAGSTQYCYDRFGQLVRKVQTSNGRALTLRYAYTLAGRLSSITYPDGAVVSYQRDAHGRVTRVDAKHAGGVTETLLSQATHHAFGAIAGWTYGNGRVLSREVDLNYQPKAVRDPAAGGLSVAFGFDEASNLTSLTPSTGPAVKLDYDALGRLTYLRDSPTGAAIDSYTYDATGNRLSFANSAGSQVYTYPVDNHRLSQAGSGGARGYDASGNTTAVGSDGFVYNDAGQLGQFKQSGVVKASYQYNGAGEQVRKSVAGAERYAIYDEAGHWLGEYDGNGATIQQAIWLDDLPAGVWSGHGAQQKLFYVEADHLGTPRVVIDPVRDVAVWNWDLKGEAFGNSPPNQDPDLDGTAFAFNLRFPGQVFDSISGLSYNYFRYYEAASGRYTQSDPIGLGGGLATYSYVGNAPLTRIDPFGLEAVLPASSPVPPVNWSWLRAAGGRAGGVGLAGWAGWEVGSYIHRNNSELISDLIANAANACRFDFYCRILEAEIAARVAELRQRYFEALNDRQDLFGRAFLDRNLGRRKGTWVGHQIQFYGLQRGLRKLIKDAISKGCRVSSEDISLATAAYPNQPLPR